MRVRGPRIRAVDAGDQVAQPRPHWPQKCAPGGAPAPHSRQACRVGVMVSEVMVGTGTCGRRPPEARSGRDEEGRVTSEMAYQPTRVEITPGGGQTGPHIVRLVSPETYPETWERTTATVDLLGGSGASGQRPEGDAEQRGFGQPLFRDVENHPGEASLIRAGCIPTWRRCRRRGGPDGPMRCRGCW